MSVAGRKKKMDTRVGAFIGFVIDEARRNQGISKSELARRRGVAYQTVLRHMTKGITGIDLICDYCTELGLDPGQTVGKAWDMETSR